MRIRQRIIRVLPWACSAVALIGLGAAMPFLLNWAAPESTDWDRLSSISQTYAALSIPLSGAALLGVVWSLIFQARALEKDSNDRYRGALRELLLHTAEDPSLLVCWDPPMSPMTQEQYRLQIFNNAIILSWRAEYLNGMIPDAMMRDQLYRMLRGQVGQKNYASTRALWLSQGARFSGKAKRFVQLLEEAFQAAAAAGPALTLEDYFLPDA
ncbi:DUF6082 family protein [Streptomyces sp. NPDC041068]|uniref:DUF6082 family protein n=1 Tax=Streptomyces sp. NPDC041068 TaxID=3155130 RepID=UPI0033C0CAF9